MKRSHSLAKKLEDNLFLKAEAGPRNMGIDGDNIH